MNMYSDGGYWNEPDVLLTRLIMMLVNTRQVELGITVMVKGMILSGTMISEAEYLKAISDTLVKEAQDALGPNATQEELALVAQAFNMSDLVEDKLARLQLFDEITGIPSTEEDFDEDEWDDIVTSAIRHLHLKDVMVLAPVLHEGFSESHVPTWRLKLTSIDGWVLGQAVPFMPPSGPTRTDD